MDTVSKMEEALDTTLVDRSDPLRSGLAAIEMDLLGTAVG
jgi:hypothetical protein